MALQNRFLPLALLPLNSPKGHLSSNSDALNDAQISHRVTSSIGQAQQGLRNILGEKVKPNKKSRVKQSPLEPRLENKHNDSYDVIPDPQTLRIRCYVHNKPQHPVVNSHQIERSVIKPSQTSQKRDKSIREFPGKVSHLPTDARPNTHTNECLHRPVSNRQHPNHYKQLLRQELQSNALLDPLSFETTDNTIPVTIQGNLQQGLVDTGADLCSIKESIVNQDPQLSNLHRFQPKITTAISACQNGSVVFKYVIYPKVEVGTFTVTLPFFVTENCTTDVILGVPFLKKTRAHLDFGPTSCIITFNNIVLTNRSTLIPANTTKLVSCSPTALHVPPGPILVSTNLLPRYDGKLFAQDIYVDIARTKDKLVFQIPVTNNTNRDITMPVDIRIGYILFLNIDDGHTVHTDDHIKLNKLSGNPSQITGLDRALQSLTQPGLGLKTQSTTETKGNMSTETTESTQVFEPLEHDLSGASHLTSDQLSQL